MTPGVGNPEARFSRTGGFKVRQRLEIANATSTKNYPGRPCQGNPGNKPVLAMSPYNDNANKGSDSSSHEQSTCPTCGDSFKSERGMKCHHTSAHGESLAGVERECDHCGETVRVKPWRAETDQNHFCDRECMGSHREENYVREGHPRWVGDDAVNECDLCGEEYRTSKFRQTHRGGTKYCSQECASEANSESLKVECANCCEELERKPAHDERVDNHFCDRECYAEYYSGENSPHWKEDHEPKLYEIPEWKWLRRRILRRDSSACRHCSMSQKDHMEKYGSELEVHHIIPVSEHPEGKFDPSNLITLCVGCHKTFEYLSPEQQRSRLAHVQTTLEEYGGAAL